MVLSVFAGSVAFAGSAAAVNQDDADETLESSNTYWQGQELFVSGSDLGLSEDTTLQIRRVDSDSEVAGLVTEFTLDEDQAALIDTDNLDGEYVITSDSNTVHEVDSNGQLQAGVTGSDTANVDAASWEVAVQTLTTETDEDDTEVLQESTAQIDVTSNRGSFQLDVTAEGLDSEDLEEIFNQGDNTFVSENEDDDEVTLQVSGDDEIFANFSEFDTVGDYTFDFEVNDTTASDSASVTVNELDTDISFAQSVTTEEVGDNAEITINMEDSTEAWVFIGGEDVNYLESVHVVDDDEDGEVVLEMNTFLAGQGAGASDDAYDVAGDDVLGDEGVTRYDSSDFDDIEIDSSLSNRLAAGDYDLRVASSGDIDADGDVEDEKDVGTLALRERSTDGIQTWVAPDGAANSDDLEDLLGEVSESNTVVKGDRLVVQVEASGLYGYVEDEDLSTLAGQGLQLKFEQTNPDANQEEVIIDQDDLATLSPSEGQLYTDEDNNTFFVVIDTGAIDAMEDGQEHEVSFSVVGEDSEISDDELGGEFNPYVDDEEEQTVTTDLSIEDAEAEFDNLQDGDLVVPKSSSAAVTGTSNLAPGTELTVRLRSSNSNSPFLKSDTVEVQTDGTFSAEFDMSDVAAGAEFDASIRKGGTELESVDGVVGEGASAEVTFDDQETDGSSVVVSSVTLSEGGFVTIHDATLLDGDAAGSVVGTSEYLDAGTHEDVEVSLDSTLEEDQELIAMPHMDSNGNEEYDFVTSEGADDGPYTGEDGNAVTDSAQITIGTGGTTTTGTATTTTSGTTTTAATTSTTTDSTTSEPTTTEEEGPGFGALAAVIALIAAALLAVRRSN
ncbi:DUF7282 domain-containing protein [Haladaptatus sp. ZSTT2]|uniref:DUF7282 domain-containing protein n=1 Tax=Haladaptatus sp. ZSTT2 TaxID=3120515 RepID=UPI003FA5A6EA